MSISACFGHLIRMLFEVGFGEISISSSKFIILSFVILQNVGVGIGSGVE